MREIRLIKIVIFMGLIFLSAGQSFSAACDFVPVEGKKYQYKLGWKEKEPVCQNYLQHLNTMGLPPTSLCRFVPPPNDPDYRTLDWEPVDLDRYLPLLRTILSNDVTRTQDGFNYFWDIFDKIRTEKSFPIMLEKTQIQIFPDGRINTILKLTFRPCFWGMEPSLFMLNEDATKAERGDGRLTFTANNGGGDLFYYKDRLYVARIWNRLWPEGCDSNYVFGELSVYQSLDDQYKVSLKSSTCQFGVIDERIIHVKRKD